MRRMFRDVLESAARPSTQECPSHHAEDMGAILLVLSSFSDVIRTTGVPQYRIAGEMMVCSLADMVTNVDESWGLKNRVVSRVVDRWIIGKCVELCKAYC